MTLTMQDIPTAVLILSGPAAFITAVYIDTRSVKDTALFTLRSIFVLIPVTLLGMIQVGIPSGILLCVGAIFVRALGIHMSAEAVIVLCTLSHLLFYPINFKLMQRRHYETV